MEENNNNNENKIVEQGKQMAKDAVKSAVKKPVKKVVMMALPYIGMFFLILLIIGVLNAITYLIQSWFTSLFNPTDATSTEGEAQIQSVISINDDGKYIVKSDEFAEKVKTELEAKYVDLEDLEMITEDFGNLIEKYIEAEFKTMLPKTGKWSDFDGNVIIKRQFADGKGLKELDYISYKSFMNKINSQDSSVLEKFSINPENFNLMIAEQSTEKQTYKDFDKKVIDNKSSSSGISIAGDPKEGIDYIKLIQNYGAPFNFFLSMHMIALDADFMNDLVDMVLNGNSPIVLTYVDSMSTEQIEYNYSGITTNYNRTTGYTVQDDGTRKMLTPAIEKLTSTTINNDNVKDYDPIYSSITVNDYWQLTSTYSSGNIYITSADTWLKKTKKKIEDKSVPETSETVITNPDFVPEKSAAIKIESSEDPDTKKKTEKWKYSVLEEYKEEVTNKRKNAVYTVVEEENKIKVEEFIDFIEQYPDVVDNLKSAPSQLFYSLENDESTQKLAQVMRYVLLHLTGTDYGVTLQQLEYLLTDQEEYVSGSKLLREYIRCWEHSTPPPTNADGTCYIIETDGAGHPTVGYGIDIENGGYKDLFLANGYPINIGGEVPRDFVDKLEDKAVKGKLESVKSITSGLNLTSYQINALVSRAYNCGTSGALEVERGKELLNFVDSYKKYWNQEKDDQYEERNNVADFKHELYIQYMSKPVTSEGAYMPGLERRRKSEWTLFQTGYYDVLGKWSTSGDDIVSIADEIHKYMEAHNYTYCVLVDYDQGDECVQKAKAHGLNVTFEESTKEHHNTCCATYVSWVLQEAGYIERSEHTNGAYAMKDLLLRKGWIQITNPADFLPGDVLYYSRGHVDIYAGDNTKYNAGSGGVIRGASPAECDLSSVTYALRAPK